MAAQPEFLLSPTWARPGDMGPMRTAAIVSLWRSTSDGHRIIDQTSGSRLGPAQGLMLGLMIGASLWLAIGLTAWLVLR